MIAGKRRLEAYRRLGRDTIEVRVAADLDTAAVLLEAERDENTCRLDMKPSEKVALGLALEELEKPKAAGRRTANLPGQTDPGGHLDGDAGRVREVVGPAVGLSSKTYDRAKQVVQAKDDPDLAVRKVADALELAAAIEAQQ